MGLVASEETLEGFPSLLLPLPLSATEGHSEKASTYKPEGRFAPETDYAAFLILAFQPPEI